MGKLDGKVCLITGASRGIGRDTALLFAAEGARVACAARTLHEGDHIYEGSLEGTVAAVRDRGGDARAFQANVSEQADCERLVQEVLEHYGRVDVLVNNAALAYFTPVIETPASKWRRSILVNLHAPIALSQLVLPGMVERKSGAIVNVSSSVAVGPGRGPYPTTSGRAGSFSTTYGAGKAGLERFTQGLASEVFADGVSVTCVAPSQVVPSPNTEAMGVVDDASSEPPAWMPMAILLLATEPASKVAGRVTYSQEILAEYGLITAKGGTGIDHPGSGYSQV